MNGMIIPRDPNNNQARIIGGADHFFAFDDQCTARFNGKAE